MKFLKDYLLLLPAIDEDHLATVVEKRLEQSLEKSIRQICHTMDKYGANGSHIWRLMDNRQLILRRDWKKYNKQLSPDQDGITIREWENYHHWLLANACWTGFLTSFEDTFTIKMKDTWFDPPSLLLRPEYRPLFGMMTGVDQVGSPCISMRNENYGDCITLNPNWYDYLAEIS